MLLFMDSADHYATADITEKWTQLISVNGSENPPVIGAYGRNSTNGIRLQAPLPAGTSVSQPIGLTLAPTGAIFIIGFAAKFTAFSHTIPGPSIREDSYLYSNYLVALLNVNDNLCSLEMNTDGTLTVYRTLNYPNNSVALGTTAVAVQEGVWTFIEFKVTIHDSLGTVDVRINGSSALSLTNQNTRGVGAVNGWTNFKLGLWTHETGQTGPTMDVDDLYVLDGSGAVNNDFLGDVTITPIYPSGAGASTGWTPSAGDNYACVDEATPNDDTDYNATATIGAKDTYAMGNVPVGADIRAVQILASVRKATEGPGKVKLVTRSSSTDHDSDEIGIAGTDYAYVRQVRETDPATAAAWTESGFNAVEMGLKKSG